MACSTCNRLDGKIGGSHSDDSSLLLSRIADLEQKLYEKDLRDDSGTLYSRTPSLTPSRREMTCDVPVGFAHERNLPRSRRPGRDSTLAARIGSFLQRSAADLSMFITLGCASAQEQFLGSLHE